MSDPRTDQGYCERCFRSDADLRSSLDAALLEQQKLRSSLEGIAGEMENSGTMSTSHWMVTPATVQKWAARIRSSITQQTGKTDTSKS